MSPVALTVFDDMANGVSFYLGANTGGWLLGIFAAIGMLIATAFILRKGRADTPMLLILCIGIAFDIGVGWWPLWSAIFIVVILAFMVIKPFGSSSGSI